MATCEAPGEEPKLRYDNWMVVGARLSKFCQVHHAAIRNSPKLSVTGSRVGSLQSFSSVSLEKRKQTPSEAYLGLPLNLISRRFRLRVRAEKAHDPEPVPSASTNFDHERGLEAGEASSTKSLWTYLREDVDPAQCMGPLASYCFMTGFMYVQFSLKWFSLLY
jgi:hypothetical protein